MLAVNLNDILMTKNEASILAEDIGKIAANILAQINELKITPTNVESFYLGLLNRASVILKDTSFILKTNYEQQITSAFILLRVLLDDFIRALSVYSSNDGENEIILIQADALNHKFKTFQENVDINNNIYQGKHISLSTQPEIDAVLNKVLADSNFDKYFIDKNNQPKPKFKVLTPIANVFKVLMNGNTYTDASIHSHALYKELTRHVHYSNLSFPFDTEEKQKEAEINILPEALFYCYKMIQIYFEIFNKTHQITWSGEKVTEFFANQTVFIK
jgi:hypothetical protein